MNRDQALKLSPAEWHNYVQRKTADAIIRIMRGEVHPAPLKPARELNAAECAVLRVQREIGK